MASPNLSACASTSRTPMRSERADGYGCSKRSLGSRVGQNWSEPDLGLLSRETKRRAFQPFGLSSLGMLEGGVQYFHWSLGPIPPRFLSFLLNTRIENRPTLNVAIRRDGPPVFPTIKLATQQCEQPLACCEDPFEGGDPM